MLVRGNSFTDLFTKNHQLSQDAMGMTTRGRHDLRVPLHSSSFFQKRPYYKAIGAFRHLPENVWGCHDYQKL